MKRLLLVSTLTILASEAQSATVLVSEGFDYADGALVGNTPSPGPGGAWANTSGTATFVQVTSGTISIAHGSGSREDVNIGYTAQTVGILSATFDFSVTDDTVIAGGDYEYFAHFGTGTSTFFGRIDIVNPSGTGDFTVGIATTAGTAEATYATDLAFGTTYTALLTYDFSTGLSSLTIDGGATIASTTSVTATSLDAFYFRQSTSSNNETITIDNLTVTVVPEPSVALLGGLGLLGLIRRRR